MNNYPIGVFDSGVGGLTILSHINDLLPYETTIYLADQAFMPYGNKSREILIERIAKILTFFKEKEVKAVVMACNTATVMTIGEARERFSYPIIGVVPVVKTIASHTKTGVIAVFSTPATEKSPYLEDLISKFANGKTVLKVGESHLEELIEEGITGSPEVDSILKSELIPLVEKNVDAIALGCTHYPFVKENIQKIVGQNVMVADSGGAVARRVKEVLTKENLLSLQKGADLYYTTGDKSRFEEVTLKLLGVKIEAESVNL